MAAAAATSEGAQSAEQGGGGGAGTCACAACRRTCSNFEPAPLRTIPGVTSPRQIIDCDDELLLRAYTFTYVLVKSPHEEDTYAAIFALHPRIVAADGVAGTRCYFLSESGCTLQAPGPYAGDIEDALLREPTGMHRRPIECVTAYASGCETHVPTSGINLESTVLRRLWLTHAGVTVLRRYEDAARTLPGNAHFSFAEETRSIASTRGHARLYYPQGDGPCR